MVFSEIAEFALSLATPLKGQEPFPGWPHLQPYRLIRAYQLAELGHTQAANRYCEAIGNSLTRPSPYLNTSFAEELKTLHDRLTAVPQLDKGGSWMGGKMSKPSLDTIGNWLEGRFTKFIAGEGENSPPPSNDLTSGQGFTGAFSHYSTISSAVPSTSPSPQPSFTSYNGTPGSQPPPPRAGSAMSSRPPSVPQVQIDRASSAMDYHHRKGSPGPISRVYSANAATTTFAQAENTSNGYGSGRRSLDESKDHGGWWNSSFTADSAAPTPTATTFSGNGDAASNEGFISLMDVPGSPMPVSPAPGTTRHNYSANDDEDDDLGLGNSSKKSKRSMDDGDAEDATTTPTQAQKPEPSKPKVEEKKAGELPTLSIE
jgi:COPII coat assembly protein SEC16